MEIQASILLDELVEFSRDIFTDNVTEEMYLFWDQLDLAGQTAKALSDSEPETVAAISQLCGAKGSFDANRVMRTFSRTVQLALLLRLDYFEAHLRTLGRESVQLPELGISALQWGLIDLWNERQSLGPRFRRN